MNSPDPGTIRGAAGTSSHGSSQPPLRYTTPEAPTQGRFAAQRGRHHLGPLSRALDTRPLPQAHGWIGTLVTGRWLGNGMGSPGLQAAWSTHGGPRSHRTVGSEAMSSVPLGKSTLVSPSNHLLLASR